MKYLFRTAAVTALAATTLGCQTPVPTALKQPDVPQAFTSPIPSDVDVWPKPDWWQRFNSSELNDLIAEAKTNNLNLAIAIAAVLQAKANVTIERASLFPDITLNGEAQRQSTPVSQVLAQNGVTGAGTGGTGGGGAASSAKGSITQNTFGLTANATYELDFWGLAQDNLRAAHESLKAAKFNQQIVTMTVITDVGTTYLDVLALRERIKVAEQNVAAAKGILKITQEQVTNGIASNLDLAQQEALVDGVEANIPVLREQEREAVFALAILLGRPPENFDVKAQNLDGITLPLVAPGLPSALLERRPDIAQAEANLASSHANVDAARAAFFPQISLTGSGGLQSAALGTLFMGSSFGWGIGASLVQQIFDGGKLIGQYSLSKAEQLTQIATYRSTVINAFSNVETELSQTSNYAVEQEALDREVKASSEAFRISGLQYREGIVALLTVLQAQQTLFNAEDLQVQAKLAHAQAVVSLYNALGGGWEENPKDATQPTTIADNAKK
jgi:outer membrane protein, multidrug efflux system